MQVQVKSGCVYEKIQNLQVAQVSGPAVCRLNAPTHGLYCVWIETPIALLGPHQNSPASSPALPEAKIADSHVLGPPLAGRRLRRRLLWAGSLGGDAGHSLNESFAVTAGLSLQYTGACYTDTSSN